MKYDKTAGKLRYVVSKVFFVFFWTGGRHCKYVGIEKKKYWENIDAAFDFDRSHNLSYMEVIVTKLSQFVLFTC